MFKKIRIVTIFITILLSIMIIIGIMFVLDGVGIIDLGGSNSISDSSTGITDEKIKAMYDEFVKNKGKPYQMDHSNLSYDNCMDYYDCSSWTIHCLAHSGVKKIPDSTAQGIFDGYCEKVDANDRKAGDLIFLQGTYSSNETITHVGIYLGQMSVDGESGEWIIDTGSNDTGGVKISKYDNGWWNVSIFMHLVD